MSGTDGAPPPPGWYPDPAAPGQMRWWSGAGWTEHAAPAGDPVAQSPAASPAAAQSRVPIAPEPMRSDDSRFGADHFEVHQRFKLSTNVYEVRTSAGVVGWVRQKIMALKERIEIWSDEAQTELVCVVQARKVMDLRSAYDVLDGSGMRIAVLRKQFRSSLLRSTWTIESPAEEPIAHVTESSTTIAIARRLKGLLDLVPFIGWILSLVPLPYGFTWTHVATGAPLATYRRNVGMRDRYVLSIDGDPERSLDRRAAIAMAICLDALQSR